MWYSVCFCNGGCIIVCSFQNLLKHMVQKLNFTIWRFFFISNKGVVGTEDRKFLLRDSEKYI